MWDEQEVLEFFDLKAGIQKKKCLQNCLDAVVHEYRTPKLHLLIYISSKKIMS